MPIWTKQLFVLYKYYISNIFYWFCPSDGLAVQNETIQTKFCPI